MWMVIPTHTTRHLEACLAGIAAQQELPDGVVLSCDVAEPEIDAVVDKVWEHVRKVLGERTPGFVQVSRAFQGEPRLNQVRNNGIRAVQEQFGLDDSDLVLVVDGDTVLEPGAVAMHRELAREGSDGRGADVVIAYRVNLSPQQTEHLTADQLLDGWGTPDDVHALINDAAQASLANRQQRYERQQRLRAGRLTRWMVKAHKPKIIGGHHSVKASALRMVNGYDEMFKGNGCDDDDLSRRLYMVKPKLSVQIAVTKIHAFHLWHETRRPWKPGEAPDHARFNQRDREMRAAPGLDNPRDQPEVKMRWVGCELGKA